MSKKDFSGGFGNLLGDNKTEKKESVKKETVKKVATKPNEIAKKTPNKVSQEEDKVSEVRATFIVNESFLEKIKALAYWEREQIKDIVNEAFKDKIAKYEKKNGEIKPIPKSKK